MSYQGLGATAIERRGITIRPRARNGKITSLKERRITSLPRGLKERYGWGGSSRITSLRGLLGLGQDAADAIQPPPRGKPAIAMIVAWGSVMALTAGIFWATQRGPRPATANRRRRRRRRRGTRRNTRYATANRRRRSSRRRGTRRRRSSRRR